MNKSVFEQLILSSGPLYLSAVTEPLYFPLYNFPKSFTRPIFFYLLIQGKSLDNQVGYKDYEDKWPKYCQEFDPLLYKRKVNK